MTPPLRSVIAPELTPELLLRQIYLNLQDFAIFTIDINSRVTSWNLGAELIFGYGPAEMIGQSMDRLFTIDDQLAGEYLVEMSTAQRWERAADYRWHLRKDQSRFWADGVLTPIRDEHGQPIGYLKILRDVTDRKLAQDEIRRLATIDVLTGLSNRAAFDTRRSEMVALAERTDQLLLLLMIDLDQFKEVNDVLGHQAGDLLLQQTAQRIRAASRESDFVARLGGDEFALLQLNAPSPADGGVLAAKLLATLARPFLLGEREVKISASIGIAVCPVDADGPDSLLKKADLALYHAKNAGRNCYHYYTEELDMIAHRKNADHAELKQHLMNLDFYLAYQPIVDELGDTVAMEALLRLPGEMGRQPVEYIIGLARETGLLPELGRAIFLKICRQMQRWLAAGVRGLRICVNSCAYELQDAAYLCCLRTGLEQHGLEPSMVEIELTERDAIELERSGSNVVDQLREQGFRLSLDDFGTGYSSLSYLRTLRVNTIKLDKSFLHDVPDHGDADVVVRMVVQLAQDLRLNVIAEGVESEEQAAFLNQAGCVAFQGFLYSPPLSVEDATDWLLTHS
ncbi:putative bifunctional diguanylate cyclase/phosphodiesterase [Duganella sp. BuS-21]|uniref:putative bifunctional diguanylate cyclase/phosphodiesterase n=1 Tax=Duganella sp. BuS-21 TaxID=2943848 RepID=UPI0035A6D4FC